MIIAACRKTSEKIEACIDFAICKVYNKFYVRAVNSVGECFLDAEEATSSNLVRPTIKAN